MVGNAEMLNLVENVAEIAKISNNRGRSIANGDVCLEKTYLLLVTRLRFYSNSLIHILSLSNSHNTEFLQAKL